MDFKKAADKAMRLGFDVIKFGAFVVSVGFVTGLVCRLFLIGWHLLM